MRSWRRPCAAATPPFRNSSSLRNDLLLPCLARSAFHVHIGCTIDLEAMELFLMMMMCCCVLQISGELDALSHFHFSPHPGLSDGRVETLGVDGLNSKINLSSVRLEEVLPMSESASTALAPEEVRCLVASLREFSLCHSLVLRSSWSIGDGEEAREKRRAAVY